MKVGRDPPFPIGVQGEMPRDTLVCRVTYRKVLETVRRLKNDETELCGGLVDGGVWAGNMNGPGIHPDTCGYRNLSDHGEATYNRLRGGRDVSPRDGAGELLQEVSWVLLSRGGRVGEARLNLQDCSCSWGGKPGSERARGAATTPF